VGGIRDGRKGLLQLWKSKACQVHGVEKLAFRSEMFFSKVTQSQLTASTPI